MGHAITRTVVDKKSEIMRMARDFAYYNTDRMENPRGKYHGDMTIHESPVLGSYEEAEKYMDRLCTSDYRDHAIPFKDKDTQTGKTKKKWLVKIEVHC